MTPELNQLIGDVLPFILGFIGFMVVAACLVLLLSTPGSTKKTRARLSAFAPTREAAKKSYAASTQAHLKSFGEWLAATPLIGLKEKNKMATTLIAAGLRDPKSVAFLISTKVLLLVICPPVALTVISELTDLSLTGQLFILFAVAGVGWKVPDLFVGRYASMRRSRLEADIADGLDLLVICVEAGLSLEQALDRVSREMEIASPVVSEELGLTVSEMRVTPQLDIALYNFAKRADVQSIRSMVTTMIQALQYGTPLAQSLRVLSAEMRQHKLLRLEEKAARLPILMTVPLIIFILPCLFIVVGGPAVLHLMDSFSGR